MPIVNQKLLLRSGRLTADVIVNGGFIDSSEGSIGGVHRHPLCEIHYVLFGTNKVRLEKDSILVNAGDILIVPSELPHAIIPINGGEHKRAAFWVLPAAGVLTPLCELKKATVLRDNFGFEAEVLLARSELYCNRRFRCELLEARFSVLLTLLARALSGEKSEDMSVTSDELREIRIEEYLAHNFGADCSAEALSAQLHLSGRQLTRLLQRLYGSSFRQMIFEFRMGMANYYLEETALSLSEISEKVGYSSDSAFSHAYVSFYGQPPGEHRNNPLI